MQYQFYSYADRQSPLDLLLSELHTHLAAFLDRAIIAGSDPYTMIIRTIVRDLVDIGKRHVFNVDNTARV